MITTINITGGIHGNFLIKNKLINCDGFIENKDCNYGGFNLKFKTIETAKKALKTTYDILSLAEPEMIDVIGGISLHDNVLKYDNTTVSIQRVW